MKKTLLMVVLSFGFAQGTYAARCDLDARTGLPIPVEEPGVCLVESHQPAALVQRTSAGLFVVKPADTSTDYERRQHDDVWALVAPETPADFVFCPSSLLEGPLRLPGSNCLAGADQLVPGNAAFVGSGSFSVTTLLDERGAADCPTLLHATGSVVSPGGDRFALSNSLILSPVEVGCGVSYDELDLAFVPQSQFDAQQAESIKALPADSLDALNPLGTVALGPSSTTTRNAAGGADLAILQAKANSGKGGIPAVLAELAEMRGELDVLRMTQLQMVTEQGSIRASQLKTISQTADELFDVEAEWCFEAEAGAELALENFTKSFFGGKGQGGAEIHGTGVQGELRLIRGKQVVSKPYGNIAVGKLVVCVKGPLIKRLLPESSVMSIASSELVASKALTEEQQEVILDGLESSMEQLRDVVLPDVVSRFNVNGNSIVGVHGLVKELSFDPNDPLGQLEKVIDIIKIMPLNSETRNFLVDKIDVLKNLSLSSMRICKLDPRPAFLNNICTQTEGEDLADALNNVNTIVQEIKSSLNIGDGDGDDGSGGDETTAQCISEGRGQRNDCKDVCPGIGRSGRQECLAECDFDFEVYKCEVCEIAVACVGM
jgi:hypothetical protein